MMYLKCYWETNKRKEVRENKVPCNHAEMELMSAEKGFIGPSI